MGQFNIRTQSASDGPADAEIFSSTASEHIGPTGPHWHMRFGRAGGMAKLSAAMLRGKTTIWRRLTTSSAMEDRSTSDDKEDGNDDQALG